MTEKLQGHPADLLLPTTFRLKYDEKLEFSFRDMKKVMIVDLGELTMSFWVRNKNRWYFRGTQREKYRKTLQMQFSAFSYRFVVF